jgi:hypothetical protein
MVAAMKKRTLALILGATLVLGVAACGDDDDDGGSTDRTTTEQDSGDSGDSGGSASSNADVQAYCDAVDEYVQAAQDIIDDPTSGDAAELSQQGQDLAAQGQELASNAADLTPEDAQAIADCTQEATSALTPAN